MSTVLWRSLVIVIGSMRGERLRAASPAAPKGTLDCRSAQPTPRPNTRAVGSALPHLNLNLVAFFSEGEWSVAQSVGHWS
jgi:hypothetical protein